MKWKNIRYNKPPKYEWVLMSGGFTTEEDYRGELGKDLERPVVAMNSEDYDDFGFPLFRVAYWDGSWRTFYESPKYWCFIDDLSGGD